MNNKLFKYYIKNSSCVLNEVIEDADIPMLKQIIRMEIALVMYDLFRKKGLWTK